jgi:ferredoxin
VKAHVDDDRCRGHGVCWSLCPEVFDLTDDGYAVVTVAEVPEEFTEVVETATTSCPEQAITAS